MMVIGTVFKRIRKKIEYNTIEDNAIPKWRSKNNDKSYWVATSNTKLDILPINLLVKY